MKIKDIMHLDPEAEIVVDSGWGTASKITTVRVDEGVYDQDCDLYELLSENEITDLENRHMKDGDELDFVSLVVLS